MTLVPTTEATVELASAAQDARSYLEASRSANTARSYRAGWHDFAAWCERHGVDALPAAPETVATYIAERARTWKPSTIDSRLAAIAAAHRAAGETSPTGAEAVRLVRRGIRRTLGTAQRQAHAVVTSELRRLVRDVRREPDRPAGRGAAAAWLRRRAATVRARRPGRRRRRGTQRRPRAPPDTLEDRPGGRWPGGGRALRLRSVDLPRAGLQGVERGGRRGAGGRSRFPSGRPMGAARSRAPVGPGRLAGREAPGRERRARRRRALGALASCRARDLCSCSRRLGAGDHGADGAQEPPGRAAVHPQWKPLHGERRGGCGPVAPCSALAGTIGPAGRSPLAPAAAEPHRHRSSDVVGSRRRTRER